MSAGPDRDPGGGGAEPWRVSSLMAVVFVMAMLSWAFIRMGPWAAVLVIFFAIVVVGGLIFMAVRSRSSQRYALLWMLAIAADHKMPMATTVDAFAGQYRGRFRRRVSQLAALLAQGAGVSYALRAVRGLASPESAMLVEVGEESGRLGVALRRAAALQAERSALGRELASQAGYLGILLLFGQAIVAFLLYFISPKFEAIFRDFGLSLPPATVLLIQASHYVFRSLLLTLLVPILTIVVFVMLPRLAMGGVGWLPTGLSPRRHAATILRALAMTADAGRSMEAGLRTLAIRHPSWRVRRKLAAALDDVHRGLDWREALYRRSLIRSTEFEALATAQAVGNLPWAMNELADAAERRSNLRRTLLAQALWPLVVGMLGVVLLFLAVAFFLPLISLIGRLSG